MNLLNKIKSLFVPTADSIVAAAETKLRALSAKRIAKATAVREQADKLLDEAVEHMQHAHRANQVASKLGSLLH